MLATAPSYTSSQQTNEQRRNSTCCSMVSMPEQHEVASAVQTALKALQDAVLAQHGQQNSVAGSTATHCSSSITSPLSQLSVSLQDLLQRQFVLEQLSADRSIAERALRRVIANKDAEAVRLQSQVARLRHAHLAAEAAAAAAGTPTAPAPAPALDVAGRQALLDAAVAAKEKPGAAVLQLESEVAACQARISMLEAELTSAAADNSSRLAEQQKAFLAKLEQLRQVHAQQLSAAAAEAEAVAKDTNQQQQARLQALEQLLAQSKQQQEQQQATITSLQQQLAEGGAQSNSRPAAANDPNLQQGTQHRPSTKQQLVGPAAQPKQDGGRSANQATEQAASDLPSNMAASDVGTQKQAGCEVAALQLMEGQLIRLSAIIKSHQEEIAELRRALIASCAERQQLQQQLQMQQPALACLLPTAVGAARAKGSCSGNEPSKHAGGAHVKVPAVPAVARSASKSTRRS